MNAGSAARAITLPRDRLLTRLLLGGLVVSPLFFWPGMFFPYIVPRALLLYTLAQLCALHLIWRALTREVERRDTSEVFLWLVVAFVAWTLVGALASAAPIRSLFGNFERMGGVWRWLHLGLIFLWLRAVPDRSDWRFFWRAIVAVAALAVGAAIYQRHGGAWRLPLPSATSSGRVLGTFGNPGYIASFILLALGPLFLVARRAEGRWVDAGAVALAGASLYALYLSGTRAASYGLAIAVVVVLLGAGMQRVRKRGEVKTMVLTAMGLSIAGGIGAVVLLPSGADLAEIADSIFQRGTGRMRWVVWGVALEGYPEAPLLGVGLENFRLIFGEHFDPQLYALGGATRYDHAHNLLLDRLTMTGAVGLLLYLGMWLVLVRDLLGAWREERLETGIALAFTVGLGAYAIFLFFWFDHHVSLLLFLATAAFLRSERAGPMLRAGPRRDRIPGKHKLLLVLSVLVLAGVAYRYQVQPWRAAQATVMGIRTGWAGPALGTRSGPGANETAERPVSPDDSSVDAGSEDPSASSPDLIEGLDQFREALSRTDVLEWNIVERYIGALERTSRRVSPVRPGSPRARDFASHVQRAAEEVEEALAWDERNPMVYVRKGQLYTAAFRFFRRLELLEVAVESFGEAIRLNPRRIRFRHMLATAYLSAGRADDAIAELDTARRIYPHFGETYYSYGAAHLTRGDLERAIDMVREAIELEYAPASTEMLVEILRRLRANDSDEEAADLAQAYLSFRYDAYQVSGEDGVAEDKRNLGAVKNVPSDTVAAGLQRVEKFSLASADVPVAARLPVLYLRAGEPHNARATAQRLLIGLGSGRAGPETGERMRDVLRFIGDVASGRIDRWREAASVLEPDPSAAVRDPTDPGPQAPVTGDAGGR